MFNFAVLTLLLCGLDSWNEISHKHAMPRDVDNSATLFFSHSNVSFQFKNAKAMKVSVLLAFALLSFGTCDELQTAKRLTEISRGKQDNNRKGKRNPWKRETEDEICNLAKDVSVQSVYFSDHFTQLFIENSDGSRGWISKMSTMLPSDTYHRFFARSSGPEQLGNFQKMNQVPDSQDENAGKFKRVSASFLNFSDIDKEKGYLVMGLSAYEFEVKDVILYNYFPTGNVKPISDFFKEGEQKLLKPEDKLEEVVSVAIIKWVEKDKIKDHALYKIILKTVTKKLMKAHFKLNSSGQVIILNGEPFVPSVEVLQDKNQFNLFEESAFYDVKELSKLSKGYQFTSKFAFPIYYEYNPEKNTYKEYPMKTEDGFNAELETLADKLPYWTRYIVPSETFLRCPDQTFCLDISFDAVFFAGKKYYAVLDEIVYTLEFINTSPGTGAPLMSILPIYGWKEIENAFSVGARVFFMREFNVFYKTDIGKEIVDGLWIKDVFPGIDIYSVSAVVALDKQMVYLFVSNRTGGYVHQFGMETKAPPKFKPIAIKPYTEVNAALPKTVSFVFTADDKVVTIVHHFMIEQSSQTFFTQTENQAKFTLVDKYFGCSYQTLENTLTKEFVQSYVEFASPKPGADLFNDPADIRDKTDSTTDDDGRTEVKDSGSSAQISTGSFIIQAVVMILLVKF